MNQREVIHAMQAEGWRVESEEDDGTVTLVDGSGEWRVRVYRNGIRRPL